MNPGAAIAVVVGIAALAWRWLSKPSAEPKKQPATPRAFISFDFDHDEGIKRLFAGQCRKNSPTPFAAQDWSSKESLPQATWEETIEAKISSCHLMFVLVSPTAHRASGIAKEIAMATKHHVPIVGVYIKDADAATPLPPNLGRDRVHAWKWERLATAIDAAMKEGKNR
ncbi:MAG: TIR domain-containing protein [Kofleriaceae bacterium]